MSFNFVTFFVVIVVWVIGHTSTFDADEILAQMRRGYKTPKGVRRWFLVTVAAGALMALGVGFWGETLNTWIISGLIEYYESWD